MITIGNDIISGSKITVDRTDRPGQIIQSSTPLVDAGLHLADGERLEGSGIYSQFVDDMALLYNNTLPVRIQTNAILSSSIVNNNGVISGFDATNYASTPAMFSPGSSAWEMTFKFTYIENQGIQPIFGCIAANDGKGLELQIDSTAKIKVCLSSDGSTNDIANELHGSSTLLDDTTYYVKMTFTGFSYVVYLSTTGAFNGEETIELTITSSLVLYSPLATNCIGRNVHSQYASEYFLGSIDLNETYINIGVQRWWTGAESIKPTFCTEEQWQESISKYGACGKYVYNPTNNTLRLPRIVGFTEGTVDPTVLGDLVEQFVRLPNITGRLVASGNVGVFESFAGAFSGGESNTRPVQNGTGSYNLYLDTTFDASRSSSVYSGDGTNTVIQPQAIELFYYVVVATTRKTEIEVNIDEVATDLNSKVSKADLQEAQCVIETYINGTSGYRLWSDGYCEQWGRGIINECGTTTINLLKAFGNIQYCVSATSITASVVTNAEGAFHCTPTSTTQISLTAQYIDPNSQTVCWEAKGYIGA